jgi:tRNA(His) guanylyltransferase
MKDSLGDRMKGYEDAYRIALPRRVPVIVRVDGKAFHTWTRGLNKPFDEWLEEAMNRCALKLCEEIQGAKLAYIQSDEISVLINNYTKLESSAWFDNNLQKMVSISASVAAATMWDMALGYKDAPKYPAYFDSRVFLLPEHDVANYFLWRQQDATRNSIQMLARSLYSHKELYKKNTSQLQEMCFQKGSNWNDLPTARKRGRCVYRENLIDPELKPIRHKWTVDNEIPIFKGDGREYIEKWLKPEE